MSQDYSININTNEYNVELGQDQDFTIEINQTPDVVINLNEQGPMGPQGEPGVQGLTGNGIETILQTGTSGLEDTYTIYYTNGDTQEYTVTNGEKGDDGFSPLATVTSTTTGATITITDVEGTTTANITNGIDGQDGEAATIEVGTVTTGAAGTSATVVNSGTSSAAVFDFTIPRGDKGETGETGNGISSIAQTGTSGLVDTYTIYYTDGNDTTFDVTNGQDGTDGQDGYSPTATVTQTTTGITLTVTDKNGTTTGTVDTSGLQSQIEGLSTALNGKQDVLTAGTNITIENNVISSTAQESFFRGNFNEWTDVPTDTSLYIEDIHGNRVPKDTDFIVVEDANQFIPVGELMHRLTVENLHSTEVYTIRITDENGVSKKYYYQPYQYNFVAIDDYYSLQYSSGIPGHWYIKTNDGSPITIKGTTYSSGQAQLCTTNDSATPFDVGMPPSAGQYQGAWRFAYYGVWATDGRVGWTPQYKIENTLPIADSSTLGIAKLYTTTGQNTDGAVTQKIVTDELGNKQDVISDLETIRSGASAGATALQPNDNISELNNDVGYITGITSSDVTTALGYTPYNSSNPSGYITGITSSDVTTALGYTPYNSSNPSGYISGITSSDVTTALGYTPYDSSNPNGYTSNVGTVTSVNNVSPVNGNVTLSIPTKTSDLTNDDGFITGITSSDVTTALGYTPYNSTNPSGYQANVIETIKVNGTAQTISSKAVDITVPTNNNQLTNGAGYITGITSSDVTTALGYNPYSSANPSGYQANVIETIKVNGTALTPSSKAVDITVPAAQVNSDWNSSSGVTQILNKPTIPTVNNATLTITQGGTTKGTFTANASSDVTIALDAGGGSSATYDSTNERITWA